MSSTIRIIQPSSFLSVAQVNLFHAEIKNAVESNAEVVLVDLKCIPSMSSDNFITVVKALRLIRASGCQLCLCSVSEQIRILFELTGLDQVFKVFTDVNEFERYVRLQKSAIEVPRQSKGNAASLPVDSFKLAS